MFNIQIVPSLNQLFRETILKINECIVINSNQTTPDLLIIYESSDEYYHTIKSKVHSLPVIVVTKNNNRKRNMKRNS